MTKGLKNFNSDNPDEIRAVLGPLDDPDDPELYKIDFSASGEDEHEQDLRMLYNMGIRVKREKAMALAKGIIDQDGNLIDRTLPPDMRPGSKCTV